LQIGYVSNPDLVVLSDTEAASESSAVEELVTTAVKEPVRVTTPDGHRMTTFVVMRFDDAALNASRQLNNATLLLHNNPKIKRLPTVIKIYPNASQIVQIEVRPNAERCCVEIRRRVGYAVAAWTIFSAKRTLNAVNQYCVYFV